MIQLYKPVQADAKRSILLMRLRQLGVTTSKQGVPIEKLSYEDLKHELVMAHLETRCVNEY